MEVKERLRIEGYAGDGDEHYGKIILGHLADPRTVKVFVDGQRIFPSSFDHLGNPIFTSEAQSLIYWKERNIRRNPDQKDFQLLADVTYEKATPFERYKEGFFDSQITIQNSLKSLKAFKKLLQNRDAIIKQFGKKANWTERVIFGRYLLDSFNQLWIITETEQKVPEWLSKLVVDKECFIMNVGSYSASFGVYIPYSTEKCQCCGKRFTIKDIRLGSCIRMDCKTYHESCYKNYERQRLIARFTNMIDCLYHNAPYELLPNGYHKMECCAHKPWFLFHTPDGDIKIGWRKRVINIEWLENYKPFDMAIFNSEDVTKQINGSYMCKVIEPGSTPTNACRLIHAWSEEMAYNYLGRAKKAANGEKE